MRKQVHFHITGFGTFAGVAENPTEKIVKSLIQYLEKHPLENKEYLLVKSLNVLEVSAIDSLLHLHLLQREQRERFPKNDQVEVIWLHFGVGTNVKPHLETTAYNEATFRVPDQRGWQPQGQLVLKTSEANLISSLGDLEWLRKDLESRGQTSFLSVDPGRFICNWVYFHSLMYSKQNNTHSLFVHFPPEHHMPIENQLEFVVELLNSIGNKLSTSDSQPEKSPPTPYLN